MYCSGFCCFDYILQSILHIQIIFQNCKASFVHYTEKMSLCIDKKSLEKNGFQPGFFGDGSSTFLEFVGFASRLQEIRRYWILPKTRKNPGRPGLIRTYT